MVAKDDPRMEAGWASVDVGSEAFYSQGGETAKIPRSMHKENRARVLQLMAGDALEGSVIFVKGGDQQCRDDTDHEEIFRQESNFHYLFGVAEAGCFGTVSVPDGKATLFVPRLPDSYAVWMGKIATLEMFKRKYEVDEVAYVDEIPGFMKTAGPACIYVYSGVNSDSKSVGVPASFDGIERFRVDTGLLHPALFEARVVKSEKELRALRFANQVSSRAHISVMQKVRPGQMEYQMEADFLHYCYYHGGMRHAAYTAICGCGPNAAVLHYGHAGAPNNRTLTAEEVVLNDMGCEYYCYASDITCSFPVSGTFSPAQRGIYEAVLDSSIKTAQAAGPGKSWVELHKLSTRVIAEHLIRLGYLHGTLDDVVAAGVDDLFMPHGLGHLMGIDTHDVGGIPPGVEKFKALRMNRELLPGMVLTIEPGCYFIPAVLEPAFKDEAKAKHLDEAKIRGMFGFGGVRIEDNLVVTDAGLELLTAVPRTIKEVEAVMAGADFPLPDSDYPLKRPNVAGSGLPVWTPAPAAPAAAPAGGAKRARK